MAVGPALPFAPAEFVTKADRSPSPSETRAKPVASSPTLAVALRSNDLLYRHDRDERLVAFNLQDADLIDLVNHISGVTGKRFIYGARIRQIKATVVSPEPVTLEEAYEVFLSILESNGMSVVPHGRFLKIVDTGGVTGQVTPIYGIGEATPSSDRFLTRLYRVRNVNAEDAANVLSKFKGKEGDISFHAPSQLLVITDTGSNVARLLRLLEEVDIPIASQSLWVERVHYRLANDLAQRMSDIFSLNQPGPASVSGLTKVIGDQASNSLLIVGRKEGYLRLLEVLKQLDEPPDGQGRVRRLPLQHANAEELAVVLGQIVQAAKPAPQNAGGSVADQLFEGEIKVIADKSTNSLLVTSSGHDYASVRIAVMKLDMPRRQVFIEAVILDLDESESGSKGAAWHAGAMTDLSGGGNTLLATGFMGSKSIGFPNNQDLLQGFAAGVRGPGLEGTQNLITSGVSIPAFGVVLNALVTSGASNVLSMPHIIATDNIAAEINISRNVALQQNVSSGLSSLASLAGSSSGSASALTGQSGSGSGSTRQDVGIKIKITPHVNGTNQVRLELDVESSDTGAAEGSLGAVPIIKRNAHTMVTVDDQQTVVIGGLMRETVSKAEQKIPLLGDIPVIGYLFKQETDERKKSNLLLMLTPYIICEQADLRKIFERKIHERQEFLDRAFVFTDSKWSAPKDYTRTNGLVEDIRQSYRIVETQARLRAESQLPKRVHVPSNPVEIEPTGVRETSSTVSPREVP